MSAAETPAAPKPNRFSGLLALVRQLIDYGRHLAITLRSNPHPLGAGDIALILARITRGLLRAEALEARLIRSAARPDAAPAPPCAPSHRRSPPARATAQPTDTTQSRLAHLPTPEQIAAEVRRRPIGAVIAATSAATSASCRAIRCGGNCNWSSSAMAAAWPDW
jgi:hypothetical protein